MSKIVQAVNAMISNPDKISGVVVQERKYFFLYDRKYKWSISRYTTDSGTDEYFLRYYPGDDTLEQLAAERVMADEKVVSYDTEEIGTREARESFRELCTTVKERLLNVNKALDEIIKDGEIFT